jgi:ATP-dependent DNA ligase
MPSTFYGSMAKTFARRRRLSGKPCCSALQHLRARSTGGLQRARPRSRQQLFEHGAKLHYEGIISKRADAPYRSDRNEGWLKIKTVHRGQFPVIGFIKDPSGVAALYLGKQEGKELRYMGKVGTGWSRTVSSQIRKQLETVVSPKSKLSKPVRKPKAPG